MPNITYKQTNKLAGREQNLLDAVTTKNTYSLKSLLCQAAALKVYHFLFISACAHGREIRVKSFLHEANKSENHSLLIAEEAMALRLAARNKHFNIIEILLEYAKDSTRQAMLKAGAAAVQSVIEHKAPVILSAMLSKSEEETLKYILQNLNLASLEKAIEVKAILALLIQFLPHNPPNIEKLWEQGREAVPSAQLDKLFSKLALFYTYQQKFTWAEIMLSKIQLPKVQTTLEVPTIKWIEANSPIAENFQTLYNIALSCHNIYKPTVTQNSPAFQKWQRLFEAKEVLTHIFSFLSNDLEELFSMLLAFKDKTSVNYSTVKASWPQSLQNLAKFLKVRKQGESVLKKFLEGEVIMEEIQICTLEDFLTLTKQERQAILGGNEEYNSELLPLEGLEF